MKARLQYQEIADQPYENVRFSAGFVNGHPIDTVYLRLERNEEDPLTILLRPDEMAAIQHVTAGVLWSHLVATIDRAEAAESNRDEWRKLYQDTLAAQQWQPIETAPKDGTAILVYDEGAALVTWEVYRRHQEEHADWCLMDSWQDEQGGYSTVNHPTHWMPLPEPPAAPDYLESEAAGMRERAESMVNGGAA